MNEHHNIQLTNDPAAMDKVAKLNAKLKGRAHMGKIEMHSGITYSGLVSAYYFGEVTEARGRRAGGYILITVDGRKYRLDALDIKSWSFAPV